MNAARDSLKTDHIISKCVIRIHVTEMVNTAYHQVKSNRKSGNHSRIIMEKQ